MLGTTLGMLLANVPAVLLGDVVAHRLPVKTLQAVAAALSRRSGSRCSSERVSASSVSPFWR